MSAIPIMQNMGNASSQASQESSGRRKRRAPSKQRSQDLCGEDLAHLDHDEREAAVRRAKNREAARKSRERKMMRVDNLTTSVRELMAENELLSKCIQEISQQAASAEAETRLMREQIQTIRAMAASDEDRKVIDRLLQNAISVAHSQLPHCQVPFQAHQQNSIPNRTSSEDNGEAALWAGLSPAQSPLMQAYTQRFMMPEDLAVGEHPSSGSENILPEAAHCRQSAPMSRQGADVGSACGFSAANRGSAGGSPGRQQQLGLDRTPGAFQVGPPLGAHPKRIRSVRGGGPKRVSPPSAESYGGPIMLPLPHLHYQGAGCQLDGPAVLRREGSLDLLEAAGGLPSPDSLLAGSLSSEHASFGSGGSLPLGPMHDLFLDGGPMLPPGAFPHTGAML